MIAIGRNLSFLLSPNSLLRNSNLLFSTWRLKNLIPDPEIYDVLVHKHNFPPDLASRVSSSLHQNRCPKRVDSLLSFLHDNRFTTSQVQKLVLFNPRVLGFSIEGLKFRLGVFQDLGLSPEEIAKMVTSNTSILDASVENRIIPSLSKLKGLLPSTQHVAKLLRKLPWFLKTDLERTLIPNMEILKSFGIPMDRTLYFLYAYPRPFLAKPFIMRRSVEKAIEMGATWRSSVLSVFLPLRMKGSGNSSCKLSEIWDFLTVIYSQCSGRHHRFFFGSTKKMQIAIELLLANGKYNTSNIVNNPVSLGCSIGKRLEPRLQILGLLERMNLMKKWPGLSRVVTFTDDKFFDRFIRPYMDEIGDEYVIKKYVEGKKK